MEVRFRGQGMPIAGHYPDFVGQPSAQIEIHLDWDRHTKRPKSPNFPAFACRQDTPTAVHLSRFDAELFLDCQAYVGECPVWWGERSSLVWVDPPRRVVHVTEVGTVYGATEQAEDPETPGFEGFGAYGGSGEAHSTVKSEDPQDAPDSGGSRPPVQPESIAPLL